MSDLFISTAKKPRRGRRPAIVGLITLIVLLFVVAAVLGGIAVVDRGTVPAGTTVDSVDLGGMSRDEAMEAITSTAGARMRQPIRLIGAGGVARTSGIDLGAQPLVDEALAEAFAIGTLDRMLRRVGIGGRKELQLAYRLGPVRAAELADMLDARFGEPARDAALTVSATGTTVVAPSQGTHVDRRALRRGLRTLPAELGVPIETELPAVDIADARRAARRVDRLLDGPRVVRFRGVDATLPVSVVRSLVTTAPAAGELAVGLDPDGLRKALSRKLGRFEQPPRDARFVVDGSRVRVAPSAPGRRLDVERIGASLVSNPGAVAHRARFRTSNPAFSTAAARKLRVTELVSEFTTYYSCCQPRVTNIKRAAQLLDGTLIKPGKKFSMNGVLGKRTVEKGFVAAPQIYAGRLEDAVGGGISQVATTLFNAAFFSGIKLVAHRAHQFYISRYPMGREATVSWGGPELIFRNDWPAAILMKLEAGETGITVRFYSTKLGRRVITTTGEPYATTAPRTITISNPSLAAGTTETVQDAGEPGFSVQYTRKVFRKGELVRNEAYTVRYEAKNAVVEVGPPKPVSPEPKPKPQPKPVPKAQPEQGAAGGTGT